MARDDASLIFLRLQPHDIFHIGDSVTSLPEYANGKGNLMLHGMPCRVIREDNRYLTVCLLKDEVYETKNTDYIKQFQYLNYTYVLNDKKDSVMRTVRQYFPNEAYKLWLAPTHTWCKLTDHNDIKWWSDANERRIKNIS